MDGDLGKWWGCRLGGGCTTPPNLCYSLSIKELSAPHWMCSRNPSNTLDRPIPQAMYLKDIQISAQQKSTLTHIGLHSNCLNLSEPCCVSMSLTYTAARAPALSSRPRTQFIKTSAGTNLIPSAWWLSYPAVTHSEIAGQRLAGASKCQTDRKAKEMSESVLLHSQC